MSEQSIKVNAHRQLKWLAKGAMAMANDMVLDTEPGTAMDTAMDRDIEAGITFLYYRDLAAAHAFYRDVLGLRLARDQGWCKIMALTPSAYVGLVDETRGSLRAAADKPVMLTLVVANVDAWHSKLAAAGVADVTQPALHEDIGIYGFFASDPEGYRLEIQSFLRPLS